MAFEREPTRYEKTVLSDLQGAWQNLRDAVVEHAGFGGWERALPHIDDRMPKQLIGPAEICIGQHMYSKA